MEIKHLFFSYGKNQVIKDLSIEFEEGKITTLLGSNGCGKSTLFNLCTRNLKAKMGMISLNGKNINSIERKEFAKKSCHSKAKKPYSRRYKSRGTRSLWKKSLYKFYGKTK